MVWTADSDLSGRGIDLVDHAADDVAIPLIGPRSWMMPSPITEIEPGARDRSVRLTGRVGVGIFLGCGDFEPELILASTIFLGLILHGRVALVGFLGAGRLKVVLGGFGCGLDWVSICELAWLDWVCAWVIWRFAF